MKRKETEKKLRGLLFYFAFPVPLISLRAHRNWEAIEGLTFTYSVFSVSFPYDQGTMFIVFVYKCLFWLCNFQAVLPV